MSKKEKVEANRRKENDEAMKEVSIKRNLEEECRIGLMEYFTDTLTVEQTARLMEDVHEIKVHSLWEDRWRVNVLTKTPHGDISFKNGIKASFFIVWSEEFGLTYINPNPTELINRNFINKKGNIFA